MLIRDFSGGLNTRVAPHLLQPTEAQVYTNIDNSAGTLRPIKGPTSTGVALGNYFAYYYAGAQWVYRATQANFVEFNNIMYISDGVTLKKFDGALKDIGIAKGTTPLSITVTPGIITDNSVRNYTYTYYDSATGIESQPATFSADVKGNIGTIVIGAIPASLNATVTNIRLYRIGGLLTQYTLVATLANGITSYTDSVTDISIAGAHILDSVYNGIPPSGLQFVTEAYAMLFASVGNKLYFSSIGRPYAWPEINFITFSEVITGIGCLSNGLLIFTKYKTYIVLGTAPEDFTKYLLSGSQGCINHNTIQFVDNNLLWLSTDGVCATTGGIISVISNPKIGKFTALTVYGAAVLDNVYYLSYADALGNKLMAYDFRFNQVIRLITVIGNNVVVANDTLYQHYNSTLQTLLTGSSQSMSYRSPKFNDSNVQIKLYDNVLVNFGNVTGLTGTVKVYIGGILNSTTTLAGTKESNYIEIIASKYAIGNSIEFEITGTVEIFEISYKAYDRDNIFTSIAFYRNTEFPESVLVNGQPYVFYYTGTSYKSNAIPFSITNSKTIGDLYLTFIGTVSLDVIVNGVVAKTYSLTSTTLTTIEKKTPASNTRGYYFEFEYRLSAGARLYAIELPVMGRQNVQ